MDTSKMSMPRNYIPIGAQKRSNVYDLTTIVSQ